MSRMLIETSWREKMQEELGKSYIVDLQSFLEEERRSGCIFPPEEEVFAAFSRTPYERVKVVIMGQDPYHGAGQAHGLCFSVREGVAVPPSLRNIYKEIREDVGEEVPEHGSLESWAKQGVLLLNATLTVREGQAKSHYGRGWERLTDAVIDLLSDREDPMVFVLWGRSAKEKCGRILKKKQHNHVVIESAHPSPLSAHGGFFGSRPFSKINGCLQKWGKTPIRWGV